MQMLLAAALIAQAADPICADIAKLAEGVREEVPFASLAAAKFAPGLIGYPSCVGYPQVYFCNRSLLPPEITETGVAAQIAACLPDAKISVEKRGVWSPDKTIVRGSGLVFTLDESGTERSHVGRTLHITIQSEADAARLRD